MSDGRFSSRPMRSASGPHLPWSTTAVSAEKPAASPARDLLGSPAVQREVQALVEQEFPDVGALKCAPFPRHTPAGALAMGHPLASAVLVQEYLIGLLFLRICGWVFMAFGALILLTAVIVLIDSANRGMLRILPLGLGIGGVGLWFGVLRGRVVNERCWFCPRGMVWMTNGVFDWYRWEQVPEVYRKLDAARPAIGIRFDRDISWVSFNNTPASRLMVDYIENRASAAWTDTTLQMLADDRGVPFGAWRVRDGSIQSLDERVPWTEVVDLEQQERAFVIHHGQNRQWAIALDEIPYPSLFVTLARAMWASSREHRR
jgi:hypothetical protein